MKKASKVFRNFPSYWRKKYIKGNYLDFLGVYFHFELKEALWGDEVMIYNYGDESLKGLFSFKLFIQMEISRCMIGIFKSHNNIHISVLLPWFLWCNNTANSA